MRSGAESTSDELDILRPRDKARIAVDRRARALVPLAFLKAERELVVPALLRSVGWDDE